MSAINRNVSRRDLLQGASLLCIGEGAGATQKNEATRKQPPVVLGYYPDWKGLEPERLDFTLYTHICHAFAYFDKEGALRFPDAARTRKLINAAHAKGVAVLLSVGGENSNARLREQETEAFADILAQRIREFHYDGVDVDWEELESDGEAAKLSALTAALRKRLPDGLVTMAVPAGDYGGKWFHTDALRPVVDWLNIMTYDFCGPWCDTLQHNAPMPELKRSIAYWKGRGWSADKLTLGIPSYGRRMRGSRFGDPAPKGSYLPGEISYNDVERFIKEGWKPLTDASAEVPYLVKPGDGELISYEDVASSLRKGALARASGLRGFFFWEATLDFDGKSHKLGCAALRGWKGAKD